MNDDALVILLLGIVMVVAGFIGFLKDLEKKKKKR
jgi:hypothetical protein